MNWCLLLVALFPLLSKADFVYMEEGPAGKAVMLQKAGFITAENLSSIHGSDWSIYPDITPNAREVVYVSGPGQLDLHLVYRDLNTKTTKHFHPTQKGMLLHPKFTRNGRFVFYTAPGENGKNTIYFIDLKAEIARQGRHLTNYTLANAQALVPDEEAHFPRPSADGNFVVYQRNSNGKKEIILFDRLENKKTVLAQGMSPALSFDERLIAYTSKEDGNWNVYVKDRFSGVVTRATDDKKDEMAPTFKKDNTLVFASNKSGNYRLYALTNGQWLPLINGEVEAEIDHYSPQFSGEEKLQQSERTAYLGEPRSSFGTVVHQGKLYMAGGHQGAEHTYPPESFVDTFLSYDPETNQWTKLAPRPFKAHGYQLAAFGNYVYAFGGFAYSEVHKPKWKSLSSIDRYDIRTNKWETIGELHFPRSSNVAVTIDDKVYIAGGWNSTPKFENDLDGFFHDTIEVFDLKTEKLIIAPYTVPLPKRRALTGINHNGKLLLIGGLGEGASHFELLSSVTALDPVTGESSELPKLPFATFAPAAEVIGDELFVFGGMFKTGPWNYEYVAHIYGLNFTSGRWRHTGRYLQETKGFSQAFQLEPGLLGILGGHRYFEGMDSPVRTFETLSFK
jgi:N-acetylneuraminic acid mutarotase